MCLIMSNGAVLKLARDKDHENGHHHILMDMMA